MLIPLLRGDAEMNSGPKLISKESFSVYQWNFKRVTAQKYTKILLLKSYIAIYKFDIICFSETYLESIILPDDENLVISRYKLVHSDHHSNSKRGAVCSFYKDTLSLRVT